MSTLTRLSALKQEVERLTARKSRHPACPSGMRVQSIVFSRSFGGIPEMKAWLRGHGMLAPMADRRANTVRFRQESPRHFSMMRTISIAPFIQMVVGCPAASRVRRLKYKPAGRTRLA